MEIIGEDSGKLQQRIIFSPNFHNIQKTPDNLKTVTPRECHDLVGCQNSAFWRFVATFGNLHLTRAQCLGIQPRNRRLIRDVTIRHHVSARRSGKRGGKDAPRARTSNVEGNS
ncbi:hypothetical protein NPIL_501791 [Nephila pilipes]|uniref:Uncharacterized protein n=1 Tax=Nephila pilipes TaxID=299642 RepID=A0A8X6UW76_NEPPI|nr:hypothetical protein NPIL_501791 [Nephila pilipes]